MARKRGWGQHPRRKSSEARPDVRVPVSLTWDDLHRTQSNHIHGRLRFQFGERQLPYMGYFGPDDVCFHAWAAELRTMSTALSKPHRYVYDEGEQGQPAFEFSREDDDVFVSIIDSQISDGVADRRWRRVRCAWSELQKRMADFLKWYDEQQIQGWPNVKGRDKLR